MYVNNRTFFNFMLHITIIIMGFFIFIFLLRVFVAADFNWLTGSGTYTVYIDRRLEYDF